jgi:hypothetical protein
VRWRFGRRSRACDSAGGVAGFAGLARVCAVASLAAVNFGRAGVAVWGVEACGRRRAGVSRKREAISRGSSFYKRARSPRRGNGGFCNLSTNHASENPFVRPALHVICAPPGPQAVRRRRALRTAARFCCLAGGRRHQTEESHLRIRSVCRQTLRTETTVRRILVPRRAPKANPCPAYLASLLCDVVLQF